jgi:hypothetical protein
MYARTPSNNLANPYPTKNLYQQGVRLMRKLTILFLLIVIGVVSITTALPSNAAFPLKRSSHESYMANIPQQQSHPFADAMDGSANPFLIKDYVAYDLFFRSLVFGPEESNLADSRLQALAKELKLTDAEVTALRAVAEEFTQQVGVLDRQVAQIKDKHLPNLSSQDVDRLVNLQAQKEATINSTIEALPAQIGPKGAAKIRVHINKSFMRKIRSVKPSDDLHLNHAAGMKMSGALSSSSPSLPTSVQQRVGMNGYGHLVIDGWYDSNNAYVRGTVTEDYNAYGHKWSVKADICNPDRTRTASNTMQWYSATLSSTASLPLLLNDGDFCIDVILQEICPYLGLLALGAFQGGPVTVPPFVSIGNVFFTDPLTINTSTTTTLKVTMTASANLPSNTTVGALTVGPSSASGSVAFNITPTTSTVTISGGQSIEADFVFAVRSPPTATVTVKGTASFNKTATTVNLVGPSFKESSNQLTVNP